MITFNLRPYQLKIRDQLPTLAILLLFAWPLFTIWINYALSQIFNSPQTLPATAAITLGACFYIIWNDFRRRPAGELKIGSGRLVFTAWTGQPIDISLRDVKKKVFFNFPNGRASIMAIYVRGWPRKILVHGERLDPGVSLREVDEALTSSIAAMGTAADVARASEASARWREAVLRLNSSGFMRGLRWVHYVGAAAALLVLLLLRK
jgi:hypothetical protein